jgi:oligopeptide transport system permease protein
MRMIVSRIIALWVIVSLTFILMHTLPGDPFYNEQSLPKEIHENLRKHYGLDDSLFRQYWRYIKGVLSWNLGPSLSYKDRTVNEIILEGFPVSAILGIKALFVALTAGLIIGTFGALHQHQWQDNLVLLLGAIGISMPSFILASLLQYTLGFQLKIFPIARWETFAHTILPTLSLAALPMAFIARMIRSSLIEVLKLDYIKAARSKGINEWRVIWIHAMPNAVLPVFSYLGPLTANIMVGSFVVEKIFAIPGLGQWFVNSITNRDYSVIMGLTVFYSVILLSLILIVDLSYRYFDPRLKAFASNF